MKDAFRRASRTINQQDGLIISNYYVTGTGPKAIPEIILQELIF